MTERLLVAAIDFGTTYSGWAFSFRHDFEADPTKIQAKQQMLIKIFSLPVLRKFQLDHTDDYLDLLREFEIKKRDIKPASDTKITLKIPSALAEVFEKETEEGIQDAIDQSPYAGKIKFTGDKMRADVSHVEIGQCIKYGEPQSERTYAPLTNTQDSVDIVVYASDEASPKYVSDKGCQQIGKVTVDVRDMSVPLSQRTLDVTLTFSGTEIEVIAKEKHTGKITKSKANFLG
ncbi:hypothetical protein MAR_023880 [Mya arenaria]|uniref:Uncharacterized protein n=1 Tax=Mya arenaria TaxID=6604 RepID=A0ABY7DP94_MYAAR|nr:hypothetical protein MAR_023880 [Mya arenaria]